MLTPDLIDVLLAPVSDASACGDDLEYDAAFIALESAAQRKPEQQFGDTVIPAVEPEWAQVQEQAVAILKRSKDVRPAVLLLRSATRLQGVQGFVLGMQLLGGLLERYWEAMHPALDAEDDNDPTMRLNALAPLADDTLVIRDLLDANIGHARGVGSVRVRDVAIARNLLNASEPQYSNAQIEGGLQEILPANATIAQAMRQVLVEVTRLQRSVNEHTQRTDAVDIARLAALGKLLTQVTDETLGASSGLDAGTSGADTESTNQVQLAAQLTHAAGPASAVGNGPIASRQEAIQLLDKVIAYLQQTEPGNPAPLLIQRAKKLIGVSFLDIINDLAPDAMGTIETVTGARADTG